ncbi:hypothetical protein V8E55_009796 [Tylopilus felleus]
MALTAIKGAIDNWADGSPSPVKFKEEQYSTIYKSHLDSLNEFESDRCGRAGVDTLSDRNDKMKAAIPNAAFMNAICEHLDQSDKLQDELEAIEEGG